MIKINYNQNTIKVRGHANFNGNNNDIVCASVSSIIYTTINGIMNIDKNAIKYVDNKILEISILKEDKIIHTLIDNMLELLEELATQYPRNIKISKGE